MNWRPVLLVCGLGRCGTSLVMQMLAAGGVECAGEPPAFEGEFNAVERITPGFLRSQRGRAVKLLDPQRCGPKLERFPECVVLWCNRDAREQAKSQIKFATILMRLPYDRSAELRMAAALVRERNHALSVLEERWPTLQLDFEELLFNPVRAMGWIASFIDPWGFHPDLARAAAAVIPRSSKCYDGLLEEELIRRFAAEQNAAATLQSAPSDAAGSGNTGGS